MHHLWSKAMLTTLDVLADNEFTQLMKGLQGERLRQAFRFFDADGDGYILPDQFQRIIVVSIRSTRPRDIRAA